MENTRAPEILPRTSSKQLFEYIKELQTEERDLADEVKKRTKKFKPAGSFNNEFWIRRKELAESQTELVRIRKRISISKFQQAEGGDEYAWTTTPEARVLLEQEEAFVFNAKQAAEQGARVKTFSDPAKKIGRAFVKLFTLGSGIGTESRRDATVQSNFRAELIERYDAKHIDPDVDGIWCCVRGEYVERDHVKAAHIFPYKYGQDVMDAIFGREEPEKPGLFSALNGLLIYEHIEEKLDRGDMIIAPNIQDLASQEEIDKWDATEVKDFKICVLNPNGKDMGKKIGVSPDAIRYKDLDGRVLAFQNDFPPRTRYLYFLYCTAMLRRAWAARGTEALRENIDRKFWGTRGKYMEYGQLCEFVQELGEEYEFLMDGAMDKDKASKSPDSQLAIMVASGMITSKPRTPGDDDEEDNEEKEDSTDDGE